MSARKISILTFVFLFLCTSCSFFARSDSPSKAKHNFLASTAALRIYVEKNNDTGFCTAVAFAKNGNKYRFFTAAHCVAVYDPKTSETMLKDASLHLIFEKSNGGTAEYDVDLLAVGEIKNFEDIAVVEAELDMDIPIMPLSQTDPTLDEDIGVVTCPFSAEAGFLYFRGYVSKTRINNLSMFENVAIKDAVAVQIIGLGTASGSSGSGVLSLGRGSVVGIIEGSIFNANGHISLVVVPISKFNNFYNEFNQGKRPLEKMKKAEVEEINQCVNPEKK